MKNNNNQLVECDSCRVKIPKSESKTLVIKGCCGPMRLPLCKECWRKVHKVND